LRRWNGWAEEGSTAALSREALRLLELEVGPPADDLPPDATLDEVLSTVPRRAPGRDLASVDAEDRPPQSRPEPARLDRWRRSGRLERCGTRSPTRHPTTTSQHCSHRGEGRRNGHPCGGGSSVVGGGDAGPDDGRRR
jgi:hypothetical protein